jgi:type II pantothenate kinase
MSRRGWTDHMPVETGAPFAGLSSDPPRPGLWWLPDEPAALDHWRPILRDNFDYLVHLIEAEGTGPRSARAAQARTVFRRFLDDLSEPWARSLAPTVHHMTLLREALVRDFDLGDPYGAVKRRETDLAVGRLLDDPAAWGLAKDPAPGPDPLTLLARLTAGNLFDLGSALTQRAFREGSMDLDASAAVMAGRIGALHEGLAETILRMGWRPWLFGGSAPAAGARRLLVFADNAGADFVLGILPLCSALAQEWSEVVVAANSTPSSNDITAAEAREAVARLVPLTRLGDLTAAGRLRVVETGTGTPGIDLGHVGAALNEAAAGCEAILIDGQGRGLETTWGARFRHPVLRVAVVKDPEVARATGCPLLDPLIRITPPARHG